MYFTITMQIWFDKPPVNSSIELDELQADCKYGYFSESLLALWYGWKRAMPMRPHDKQIDREKQRQAAARIKNLL